MNEKLNHLIEALREELQQYGAMLSLFERQQDELVRRDTDQILATAAELQTQGATIRVAREQRVHRYVELAESLSLPPDGRFAVLLDALPAQRRGQVQALMDENNRLLKRLQQVSRQNHLVLKHSLDHLTQFIHTLMGAQHQTMVYDGGGGVACPSASGLSLYEAVG
jgi:flagellar biosynthesis/type III secretory pathway chaperone